jgi:hypothetical protein
VSPTITVPSPAAAFIFDLILALTASASSGPSSEIVHSSRQPLSARARQTSSPRATGTGRPTISEVSQPISGSFPTSSVASRSSVRAAVSPVLLEVNHPSRHLNASSAGEYAESASAGSWSAVAGPGNGRPSTAAAGC